VLSSMEAIKRVAAPALQVVIPMAAVAPALWVEFPTAMAVSSPDPFVEEEGLQAHLDTAVGEDASSPDLKAARILAKVVVATWEVHQLWQILTTASRLHGYSEKPVTQKRSSHACRRVG
jgi:hypothetical protein